MTGHEPQVRATVITVQTNLQPANRTLRHLIVVADGRARSLNELDRWRLIDLNAQTVTFVDDIAKSYRIEPLASIVEKRRAAMTPAPPEGVPNAQLVSTGVRRQVLNVVASQLVIQAGAYRRELWIASSRGVPENLFATMYASEPLRSSFAPMMRNVDAALSNLRGFPFADHSELPYGKSKMIIDRNVVAIEERNVPASWLNVSRAYKEVKAPAAGRPPASSPPPSQRTPAAESQSSATSQRTP